jgi:hypothetical protein
MSAFLNSVKADLLDRRIAPLVAVGVVALLAAVGYVAFGGSSSSSTPATGSTPALSAAAGGIAVSQPTTSKAVAETTNGVAEQRQGASRNPFAPLPSVARLQAAETAKTSSATSVATSPPSSSSSSESSSTGSGSGSVTQPKSEPAPSTPAKPSNPAKPQPVYDVAVLFGVIPPETPAESAQLTPYENIKLFTALPSAQLPLIAYRGVTAKGKSATFTLVGEVILHGGAVCLPSASQCQAIGLKAGQTEQLEYLTPGGQAITYELRIVSISSKSASAASVKGLLGDSSKAGRELLSREGLMTLPGLRYSPHAGVLVLAGHPAFTAHSSSRH